MRKNLLLAFALLIVEFYSTFSALGIAQNSVLTLPSLNENVSCTSAQQAQEDVVYLKNGEIYRGEIVFRNSDILMIKTHDGKQFQLQNSDIVKIEQQAKQPEQKEEDKATVHSSVAGIVELNGGVGNCKEAVSSSPLISGTLAFGADNVFKTNSFLGVGAGYETVLLKDKAIDFIPLFVQLKARLWKKNLTPALNMKTGYAFSLNDTFKGGLLFHFAGGVNKKLTENADLFFGIYLQTQNIKGNMTETLPLGEYTSIATGSLNSIGVSLSFMF